MKRTAVGSVWKVLAWSSLILLLIYGVWQLDWLSGERPVDGVSEDQYLFLFLWENNTAALDWKPADGYQVETDVPEFSAEQAPTFHPESQQLRLPVDEAGRAPVLIYHRADVMDGLLGWRLYPVHRTPERIKLTADWDRPGAVNAGRLLSDMMLEQIEEDGTVTFRYANETISVAPGTGWASAEMLRDGKRVRTTDDETRGRMVNTALDEQLPLTVLSLFNHGWWPRAGLITAGDGE